MSRLILNEQGTVPNAPAAGKVSVYADNTSIPVLRTLDDLGNQTRQLDSRHAMANYSTANQTGFAADTYLLGSSIALASGRLPGVGATYRMLFDIVKTAAGTATPTVIVRYGTAGAIGDTAVLTFTFAAGTAAIDTGLIEVFAHFRNVGAAAVLTGTARITHHLAATGLTSTGAAGNAIILATSAGFNSAVAASVIGVSFNGGGSFAGTNTMVQAELFNPNAT